MSLIRAWFAALMVRLGLLYAIFSSMVLLRISGSNLPIPGASRFAIYTGLAVISFGLILGTKWSPPHSEAPK